MTIDQTKQTRKEINNDLRGELTRFEFVTDTGERAIILTPPSISDEDLEKLKGYLESLKKNHE